MPGRLQNSSISSWITPVPAPGSWAGRQRHAQVGRILSRCDDLAGRSQSELRERYRELRWQARSGKKLASLVEPAFALVRESARRTCGLTHYPVQLLAGLSLAAGEIAEMRTGEGKTLTSLLALALFALPQSGCHTFTANDYLAGRDANLAREVLSPLGITVASLSHDATAEMRRAAYACDITYGTEKEFGFDFLRDQLKLAEAGLSHTEPGPAGNSLAKAVCVQRGRRFALVDEADSILVDQARTPLIISGPAEHSPSHLALFRWANEAAVRLVEGREFRLDRHSRAARLTDEGCRRLIYGARPILLDELPADAIVAQVEMALLAQRGFVPDRDYIVSEGKVEIVDESTGRVLEGRKWQNGLQQAIEQRARIPLSDAMTEAASITIQNLLAGYDFLAGMTGTAHAVRQELQRDYGCSVAAIPTHRPSRLEAWGPRIFATRRAKLRAVAEEAARMIGAGRAVLIGTPSIRASEDVVAVLRESGIDYSLLHARHHRREAEIVAQAGQAGRVTVATNMAGRGTDIKLAPEVVSAGGLHVIATEMHSSARIDRQLIGRAGRQGDPGSFRFFLSLEDELLELAGHKSWIRNALSNIQGSWRRTRTPAVQPPSTPSARSTPEPASFPPDEELDAGRLRVFTTAQRRLEREHARQRRGLTRQEAQHHEVCRRLGLNPYLTRFDDSHLK